MQTYVINMDQDEIRRRAAKRQLDNVGIPFRFFRGIDGETARREFAEDYDEFSCVLNTGRGMTDGEFGCYASHRRLWQIAAETDEAVLVLEDDFTLQHGFQEALSEVSRNILEFGFIRLQTDLRARKRRIKNCGEFLLSRFTKAPHALLCYAISPATARRFLEKTEIIDAPVDVFVKKFWEHEQPLFALTPYTVVTSELALNSTIGLRIKHRKPFRVALLRFLTKCHWYVQRLIYNLNWRVRES